MDADAGLVGLEVRGAQETDVVGGHRRQPEPRGEIHRRMQIFLLLGTPGALQFQIVGVRETPRPFPGQQLGARRVAGQQRLADVAPAAAGQRNQSLRLLLQPLPFDAGPALALVFHVAARD